MYEQETQWDNVHRIRHALVSAIASGRNQNLRMYPLTSCIGQAAMSTANRMCLCTHVRMQQGGSVHKTGRAKLSTAGRFSQTTWVWQHVLHQSCRVGRLLTLAHGLTLGLCLGLGLRELRLLSRATPHGAVRIACLMLSNARVPCLTGFRRADKHVDLSY